jgi:hypothetical protein
MKKIERIKNYIKSFPVGERNYTYEMYVCNTEKNIIFSPKYKVWRILDIIDFEIIQKIILDNLENPENYYEEFNDNTFVINTKIPKYFENLKKRKQKY